ncbi:hypothetical protein MKY84_00745 [Chryseomicrobium sp. FSL W7-1435]|uniref:hypothetical protein n=1 Tax=Chryseomicrobium sp. FSL W7-1435 TaxID=2921704 RepID=UPI00315A194F
MDLKQLLNETLPKEITFSEREQQLVRERVRKKHSLKAMNLVPLVALLFIGVIGYALFVSFNDSAASPFVYHEEIIVPDTYQSALHWSVYVPETHELIFAKEDGAYSYAIDEKLTEKIANFAGPGAQHSYVANDKWLVWGDFENEDYTLNILNRSNKELAVIPSINPIELTLENNTLFYTNFYTNDHNHYMMDLTIQIPALLHTNEKMDTRGAYQNHRAVILNSFEDTSTLFVYDTLSGKLIQKQSNIPYSSVYNMHVVNDRVYFDFATEEGRLELGYMDIQTGAFQMIETPEYSFSAVHDNYLALSVTDSWGEDTDDVELFRIENNIAVPYSDFPKVKDRLVTPQFSLDGTLQMVEENYSDGGPTIHLIKP